MTEAGSAFGIPGVWLRDLVVHEDDRGYLYEVLHDVDPWVGGADQAVRQVYVVGDPARGAVRAWHRHRELHDWFCVVAGSALVGLVDGRVPVDGPPPPRARVALTGRTPRLLVVPPGVWHGWVALEDHTVLLSCASHAYRPDAPDEERVAATHFDALFGGSPWAVRGR